MSRFTRSYHETIRDAVDGEMWGVVLGAVTVVCVPLIGIILVAVGIASLIARLLT